MSHPDTWLQTGKVCKRYSICSRTLYRWLSDPSLDFPTPLIINGRRLFSESALIAWERARASRVAA
jgi:predicted DNA-binding transcriptional regulator AlpA